MSGSFDRFSGRPRQQTQPMSQGKSQVTPQAPNQGISQGGYQGAPSGSDYYDDPVTGAPTGVTGYQTGYGAASTQATGASQTGASQNSDASPDLYAPSRTSDSGRKMKSTAPVVPPASVTGRSLTLVIAIMCFLACLTAGAVWMIKQSSDAWLKDVASEVTVQVDAKDKTDIEKSVAEVVTFLEKQPGIARAKPLGLESSAELLEPWLGSSDALKSLPVPRLIAIELDRSNPPNLEEIGTVLARDFKGVALDDHRRWQQQIRAVTRSFALGGLAILALVAAATTAIIVSATKSAMASNREIVEVLHFVGATDRFIAREFEKHFLRLGIRAGVVGALSAMLVFAGMPAIMELLGGGAVSAVEMQRLIGTGSLDAAGYVLMGLVVFTIAALCMLTSRVGVYRILHGKH